MHEANINCAAGYRLVRGVSATTFDPSGNLTRGQAATILVNYVEWARNAALTANATADFDDIAGSVHASNIEKAADNGIVQGYGDRTFRSSDLVTRGQFATMAVGATERVLEAQLASDPVNAFDDDNGLVHEGSIEKATDNDMLEGRGPRTFSPHDRVSRGQSATIVVRSVSNVLYPAGAIAP